MNLALCAVIGLLLNAACQRAIQPSYEPQASDATARARAASTQTYELPAASAPRLLLTRQEPDLAPSVLAETAPPRPAPSTTAEAALEPAPEQRSYSVAFVGDSLTDYRSNGGGFIRELQRRCPESRFDNYGVGGHMTNQMRRRFAREVFAPNKPRYTHVVVFGGVNDLYSDLTANRSNDKIQEDLSAMYGLARQAGAKVVALTVAPWGGFSRYYNDKRARSTRRLNEWIMAQSGVSVDSVLDTTAVLSCGTPDRLCPAYEPPFRDGLHFGKLGHARLGEALWNSVFRDCR